jgi:hypothetical protein
MSTVTHTGPRDKSYRLKSKTAPKSFILAARNTKSFSLLYFDEKKNINRPLRYAVNQRSPFEDEQDGEFILAPIIFEDGFLNVSRTNPVLQEFLHYHPGNGNVFEEIDAEKDANKEIEKLDLEADAIIAAKGLKIDQMENLIRILFGRDPSTMDSGVIARDIKVYARNYPKEFLSTMNDPELTHKSSVRSFFDKKFLAFRNNQTAVHFNFTTNKTRMLAIPFGQDPYDATASFLQSDEGIEILKMLEVKAAE